MFSQILFFITIKLIKKKSLRNTKEGYIKLKESQM